MSTYMDPTYEFDAPQRYDFEAGSPKTGPRASGWFAAQPGSRSPLKALEANVPAVEPQPEPEQQKAKPRNIVTSWGDRTVGSTADQGISGKKRKAKNGPQDQPALKQAKDAAHKATDAMHSTSATKAGQQQRRSSARLGLAKKGAKRKEPGRGLKPGKQLLAKVLLPKRVLRPRSTKQLTVPDEFELNTSKRHKAECQASQAPPHSPYKPLAVKAKEFESKTPGRFKSKVSAAPAPKPLAATHPKDPVLWTTTRSRPSQFKPKDKLEEEEMASMPVFKASTLNPLVLSGSGKIGLPPVDKRGPTEPQPFHFITDDRLEAKAARLGRQQDGQAQDCVKTRKSHLPQGGPIVPQSPLLLTKLRAREPKAEEEPNRVFHARPIPKFLSVPSMEVKLPADPPSLTRPQPFALQTEERGQQHQAALQQRLQAEEAEARRARKLKANILPASTDMPMVPPRPEPRPLTVPEPFELASQLRHEAFQEHLMEAQKAEEARRAEAQFKARPMWRGIPFKIHEADMPLTIPEEVHMHTEERVQERELFNKTTENRWRAIEEEKRIAELDRQQAEEKERRRLRKSMVFHARPMPDFSMAPPQKPLPAKPLTMPMSPKLGRAKKTD